MKRLTLLGWIGAWALTVGGAFLAGRWSSGGNPDLPAGPASERTAREADQAQAPPATPEGGEELPLELVSAWGAGFAEEDMTSRDTTPAAVLARLQAALQSDNPIERMQGILEALQNLDADNVEEVVAALEELPRNNVDGRTLSFMVYQWASFDPEGAISYANGRDDGRSRVWLTATALRSWAETDHVAALEWLGGEGLMAEANPYLPGIMTGWAEKDPQAAALYAASLENDQMRQRSLSGIARELMNQDVLQLTAWLNGITDQSTRGDLLVSITDQMSMVDPEKSLQFLQAIDPDLSNHRATRQLVEGWAENDPAAAADFVLNLPEGETRNQSMETLVNRWARVDPVGAGEWLNQFPPSSEMDEPVARYAYQVQRADPAGAMSWATSITDTEMRNEVMVELGTRWMARDRDSATEFFETQSVAPEVKTQVETRLQQFEQRRNNARGGRGFNGGPGPPNG